MVAPLCLLRLVAGSFAQDALNGGFERGEKNPDGWALSSGKGEWTSDGHSGRGVRVMGDGKPDSMNFWRTTDLTFQPNQAYRVTFRVRRAPDAMGGTVIAGASFCNRDFDIGTEWEQRSFVFRAPSDTRGAFLRFGQWEKNGAVWFDDVELNVSQPLYTKRGNIELGNGEMIRSGRYIASARFGGEGANDWRPLASHTAFFNSNRWSFGGEQFVLYRHVVGDLTQTAAILSVNVGYHRAGRCLVEASTDGKNFVSLGAIAKVTEQQFPLPTMLFPAQVIFIRLRSSADSNLQVHNYRYEAELSGRIADLIGKTRYHGRGTPIIATPIPALEDDRFGRRLSLQGADPLGLWQCDATRKVGRKRRLPKAGITSRAIELSGAKNETESAQLVLRPPKAIEKLTATAGELRGPRGAKIPASNVEICEVAYVFVEHPTDETGVEGWWPDPLPPLKAPIRCEASQNQPLWISVRIPEDAAAGEYMGMITLDADGKTVSVPLKLRVWDFALPRVTHLRSGFGFDTGLVKRYHNLTRQAELEEVCEKYYRNFAEHRIAPFNPMNFAPIKIKKTGARDQPDVELDFTEFDKAARRALDELGFNAFMVPIEGMPWGTFHESGKGKFLGHDQDTPEYERLMAKYLGLLQAHLEQKGWLEKAYVYWFDEPEEKDYPFVIEGMQMLKRGAPRLKRMLTEEPNEKLTGHVDLWCPVLHQYEPRAAQGRQRRGEEIWWYLCTVPKAPHLTLFIDHDAMEMRLWPWATWAYGIDGILVWQTNYWHSPSAFPQALQNPWDDPMSYVSGYNTPAGAKRHWGNGDGRFTYPPHRALSKEKILDGPLNSIRWEMLREGIEDYEYFWMLRERIAKAKTDGTKTRLVANAEKLLVIPPEIFRDTRNFTRDPELLLAHRRKMAEMIERLK